MGSANYTIRGGLTEPQDFTETLSRDEMLSSIETVKNKYMSVSNNIYYLNGDIDINMKGGKYSVNGKYKTNVLNDQTA